MHKTFLHLVFFILVFVGTWQLLGKINYVGFFQIEKLTKETEKKLGDIILDSVRKDNREFNSDSVDAYVENIKQKLCKANNFPDSSITIYIFENDNVNAFALPNGQLVIYTGLIDYCETPEELCGVIAHEMAHIEHHDIMKKLTREVGISMLLTLAGGASSGGIGKEVVKIISSTAFDREQESEADKSAVKYMSKAGVDPENLANFLFRLSREKNDIPKQFEWLSNHPNSKNRASEILILRKNENHHFEKVLSEKGWLAIKKIVDESLNKGRNHSHPNK
ncbi:MAG: M48 family metallopeptidase [Bacteroidetes bacterium]|nr:M48 family metallopeptidase [Bacteroidota bacterium]